MTQTYFVECYWPGVSEAQLEDAVDRLTAEQDGDKDVTLIDSTLIPVDEIVFCVFEAPSVAAVRATTSRAGLPSERIVECVHVANSQTSGERSRNA
jgi:hypothetical protein